MSCVQVSDTVVVFAGGPAPSASTAASLPADARIVAADSGAGHALALGLRVDVAVGDFDSIAPAELDELERADVRIERYPAAKDATDLELALDAAMALRPGRIVLVGGAGGRLDHLLAELLLLGAETYAGPELDALLGPAKIHVVRGERVLAGRTGELISLLALHGPAAGVTTDGLAYPLRGETLPPGSSRGISNLFSQAEARISLQRGVLLAMRPGRTEGAPREPPGRNQPEASGGARGPSLTT
jgi:thiamine pyrophosphokinase